VSLNIRILLLNSESIMLHDISSTICCGVSKKVFKLFAVGNEEQEQKENT
jgi:hypothetical protein